MMVTAIYSQNLEIRWHVETLSMAFGTNVGDALLGLVDLKR
jgi:hypothetical protein